MNETNLTTVLTSVLFVLSEAARNQKKLQRVSKSYRVLWSYNTRLTLNLKKNKVVLGGKTLKLVLTQIQDSNFPFTAGRDTLWIIYLSRT